MLKADYLLSANMGNTADPGMQWKKVTQDTHQILPKKHLFARSQRLTCEPRRSEQNESEF